MKLFSGSSDTTENEPLSENDLKLLEAKKGSLLALDVNVESKEALPIIQLDFLEALEKLHPGFIDWYVERNLLKSGPGHNLDRVLITAGLFYKLLGNTSILHLLFSAGYLQGQKDERRRMDDLFSEKSP